MYLKQIEQLVVLQKVDGEIVLLEEELEKAPREIGQLESAYAEVEKSRKEIEEKIEIVSTQLQRLSGEIGDDSVKLKKSKSKLMMVGNTKEYHAMMREMDNMEKQNRLREEEKAALDEELTRQQAALAENSEKYDAIKAQLQTSKTNLDQRMAKAKKKLDGLSGQRKAACGAVPPPILSRYEFIRSRLRNPVIVPVNAGICSGCNISIPPQAFIELQKGQQILSCPNCQRLIYWCEHFPIKEETEAEAPAAAQA